MKRIPLGNNQGFVLVDDEDYKWLNKQNWCRLKCKNSSYAKFDRRVDGKKVSFLMHRIILNAKPHQFVDHRDGNGLNNQRFNIRICTKSENGMNQKPQKGRTSQYKGVCRFRSKWQAGIKKDGKRKLLGIFSDEIEAAKAYDKKAIEFFGEFAYLNFPEEPK